MTLKKYSSSILLIIVLKFGMAKIWGVHSAPPPPHWTEPVAFYLPTQELM